MRVVRILPVTRCQKSPPTRIDGLKGLRCEQEDIAQLHSRQERLTKSAADLGLEDTDDDISN